MPLHSCQSKPRHAPGHKLLFRQAMGNTAKPVAILASSLDIALGLSCEFKSLEMRGATRQEELARSHCLSMQMVGSMAGWSDDFKQGGASFTLFHVSNESQTTSTSFNSSFLLWVSPSQALTLESDSISFFTLESNPHKAFLKVSKGFISKLLIFQLQFFGADRGDCHLKSFTLIIGCLCRECIRRNGGRHKHRVPSFLEEIACLCALVLPQLVYFIYQNKTESIGILSEENPSPPLTLDRQNRLSWPPARTFTAINPYMWIKHVKMGGIFPLPKIHLLQPLTKFGKKIGKLCSSAKLLVCHCHRWSW